MRINRVGTYKGFTTTPGTYYALDEIIITIIVP